MPTIRDVARESDVSIATVSRIINYNEAYKVKEETRQKVWETINRLNYNPNVSTKRLSGKHKPDDKNGVKIGCIISVTAEKYSDPSQMAMLSGIEDELQQRGYSLSIMRTYKELDNPTMLQNLIDEKLNAVIMMESINPAIYKVIKENISTIVGLDTDDLTVDNVCYDRYNSAQMAVSYLIERGHTKIGFIGSATSYSQSFYEEDRYRGYRDCLLKAGIEVNPGLVKDNSWIRSVCYEKTTQLLQEHKDITAIFVASDLMAMVSLSAIYNLGLKVPEDVAVIGISNIEMSQFTTPPLTTVHIPRHELGQEVANRLILRLNGDDTLPKKIILPTKLVERSSV